MKKYKKVVFLAIVIFVFMISGVTIFDKIEESSPIPLTQNIEVTVMGNKLTLDAFLVNSTYELPMLANDIEIEVAVGDFTGFDMTINNRQVKQNETISLDIRTLSQNDFIDIKLINKNNNYESHYFIKTLPDDFPDFTSYSNDPEEGVYYTGLKNYIFKMKTNGEISFYKNVGNNWDFKQILINDQIRYIYQVYNENPSFKNLGDLYTSSSKAVIMDKNYNVIDEVEFLLSNEGKEVPIEMHDFIYIADNHYILSAYVPTLVNNIPEEIPHSNFGTRVYASVLQEIKNNEVIWEWNSTNYPSLYSSSTEGNDYFNEYLEWSDYVHFNSMVIDNKDNNLICSFRNLDSVLKIDRKSGDIIWNLGGKNDEFGLSNEQQFYKQHFAQVLNDGAITIFDNHTLYPLNGYPIVKNIKDKEFENPSSRVVKFEIDEKEKKIISFEEFKVDDRFSPAMASALEIDNENNIYLIGWGMRSSANALFSEIDFVHEEVKFELYWHNNDWSDQTYRVYKYKY